LELDDIAMDNSGKHFLKIEELQKNKKCLPAIQQSPKTMG
jgi:hypothetical protein